MMENEPRISKELVHQPDICNCPECQGGNILPVAVERAGKGFWTAILRCPDCNDSRLGLYSQGQMERLGNSLRHGEALLINEDLERMKLDGNKFIVALEADLILPEDF